MRSVFLIVLSVSLLPVVSLAQSNAQSTAQSASNAEKQAASGPLTAEGCLTGNNGRYTLGTRRGNLYLLSGNQTEFKSHNGQLVRITGTESPTNPKEQVGALKYPPPTLQVESIKKLAGTCGSE